MKMERTHDNQEALREAKRLLKLSKRKNYYKILGVEKTASQDDIKKAYRKGALRHHPGQRNKGCALELLCPGGFNLRVGCPQYVSFCVIINEGSEKAFSNQWILLCHMTRDLSLYHVTRLFM